MIIKFFQNSLIFLLLAMVCTALSFFFRDFTNFVPFAQQGRFVPLSSQSENIYFPADSPTKTNMEELYSRDYQKLLNQKLPPKEIALLLEQTYPTHLRLNQLPGERVLPGRFTQGQWYSLQALQLLVYDQKEQHLHPIKNFTTYPDPLFERIRAAYNDLLRDPKDPTAQKTIQQLIYEGYQPLAGTIYRSSLGKNLYYPSTWQLRAEDFYTHVPLIIFCIAAYFLVVAFYIASFLFQRQKLSSIAHFLFLLAFAFHTALLLLRFYILWRPPVANMLETLLYVPWIASFASLCLYSLFGSTYILLASSAAATVLLALADVHFNVYSLENVQAVLDSQYWLFIHVLMVVGSYGLFLLASLLGHFYLAGYTYKKQETPTLQLLAKMLLIVLYTGIVLLIGGTLTGGIWAAQSWGRFWDWDPKESWAFISICIYLLWVHAYRFKKISHPGLAFGAITGFLAISFTWYGVNYLLGTGLHSYGFGSGGNQFYYGFIFVELIFSAAIARSYQMSKSIDKKLNN